MRRSRFRMAASCAAVASAACLTLTGTQPASAATSYPVVYNFTTGLLQGFLAPTNPPPGANDAKLVGLEPSNNGTSFFDIVTLGWLISLLEPVNQFLSGPCKACTEQEAGSAFISALNAGGETAPGVSYTVIATSKDEVVTP